MLRRRAKHQVGVFAKRHLEALAVHLGRRRDEHQLLFLIRDFENDLGPMDVRLDRVDWLLDDELHTDGRGQVHDDVAPIDQLREHGFVGDRVDRVMETRIALQVDDVLHRSGRQVVEDEDFVAAFEERFRKMASDEARATCDQHTHRFSPYLAKCPASQGVPRP